MLRDYTEKYAAPEVLQNKKISFKADVYSLGLVLLELLGINLPLREKSSIGNKLSKLGLSILIPFFKGMLTEEPQKRIAMTEELDSLIKLMDENNWEVQIPR